MADISDILEQEKPKDAVDCATCEGRTVIGFPGMKCPDCKGLGVELTINRSKEFKKTRGK